GLDVHVTPSILEAYNNGLAQGQTPEYFFTWQLPNDDFITYPDGEYQIRVLADCGASTTISNILNGRISRSGLRLFGSPEPSDGLWTAGDEISFSFNRDLDCALISNPQFIADSIKVTNTITGMDVPFDINCRNNKLIFLIDPMSAHDGQRLEICLNGIEDAFGNTLTDPVSWAFDVITQKLYWERDTVRVEMYEGETLNLNVQLANSTLAENVTDVRLRVKDGIIEDNYLQFAPADDFDVSPSGRTINLTITASQLRTYTDIIEVSGLAGQLPEIYLEVTVRAPSPYWEVEDPNQYSNDMNIIANWKFTGSTQPTSIDSLDRIAVFIDNEIRGVANIQAASGQFHAAYLTVLGNAADVGKHLSFRVWDADTGEMYAANPLQILNFTADDLVGSTENPEILVVNKSRDLVRIIPLNQGWTWFSTNTATTAATINSLLAGLKNPAEGDIIKTDNAVAQYSAATGWYNPGGASLDNLDPNKGYMIYLENEPDTLYLTGQFAPVENIPLNEGWNWVGYPLPDKRTLNSTLTITPLLDGDVIKTRLQNDYANSKISVYNEIA
ncbi:MAG: hypothetical protein AB8G22_18470, partial [Saprospiraceae bacterium]